MQRAGVVESLMTIQAATLPGTDARILAGRLADAVSGLPVAAAAGIGQTELPRFAIAQARELAERQGMAEAAADLVMYVVRMWHQADERRFPSGRDEVAVNLRTHWEQHVCGVHSGLVSLTVFPVGLFITSAQWLTLARQCTWFAVTADAPEGLIPAA